VCVCVWCAFLCICAFCVFSPFFYFLYILHCLLYIKNVQNTLGPFQDQTQEFRVTRKRQTYFQQLFEGKGRVQAKPGSDFVWEYVLTGVSNLNTYVIPFYLS